MSPKSEASKNLRAFLLFVLLLPLFTFSPALADPTAKCNSVSECQALFEKTTKSFMGASYSYGSSGGSRGHKSFDCSGLVLSVVNKLLDHPALPRTSQAMYSSISQSVSLADAKRGDLLFFNTGGGVSHVGIYWGKDDKNRTIMFHSSSSKGVELRPLQGDKYWMSRLVGIKRFTPFTNALLLPSLPQVPDLSKFGKNRTLKSESTKKTASKTINKIAEQETENKIPTEETDKEIQEETETINKTKPNEEKTTSHKKNKTNKIASARRSHFRPLRKSYNDYLSSFQFEGDNQALSSAQPSVQNKTKSQKARYQLEVSDSYNQAVAYGDIQDQELMGEDNLSDSNIQEYTIEDSGYSDEYLYY